MFSNGSARGVARVVTEVCAPWVTNTVLFSVLGFTTGSPVAGVAAALLTGMVPMAGILVMMRCNTVGDHHVTHAAQRLPVYVWIVACLGVLIALLTLLPTSRPLWVAVLGALGFIVVFAVVTKLGLKVSVHSGLWLLAYVFLACVISPWWALGVLVWPAVMWSRITLAHHSTAEVVGGSVLSVLIVAAMIAAV